MTQTLRVPLIGIHELVLKRVRVAKRQQRAGEEFAARRVPPFRERFIMQNLEQRDKLIAVLQCLQLLVSGRASHRL